MGGRKYCARVGCMNLQEEGSRYCDEHDSDWPHDYVPSEGNAYSGGKVRKWDYDD